MSSVNDGLRKKLILALRGDERNVQNRQRAFQHLI
jgi:hypothetical protein